MAWAGKSKPKQVVVSNSNMFCFFTLLPVNTFGRVARARRVSHRVGTRTRYPNYDDKI